MGAKYSFYGNEVEVIEKEVGGGGGDIPDGSVTEEKLADDVKQDINSRATETALQEVDTKVEDLSAVQNVVDVVADLTALNAYDTSKLAVNDKIEVLSDSSQGNRATIYNWNGIAWGYVGSYGNIITGVKGSSEATYRTGNVSISKTDIGLSLVENKAMDSTPTADSQNYVSSGGVKAAIDAINQVTPEDQMKLDAIDVVEGYGDNWSAKTWTGLTNFKGNDIWTDGTNIYYSNGSTQKVLDKSTSTWTDKNWSGLTSFKAENIWTDGTDIYYSDLSSSYVLDKATSTWSTKVWPDLAPSYGKYVWTDGENVYYSEYYSNYVLNKSTSTWTEKNWLGYMELYGDNIWTDGTNIYYSNGSTQKVLDKSTSTWTDKNWSGLTNFSGKYIWNDGKGNIYYSQTNNQYVLDKSTSTWSNKTWIRLTILNGDNVWTDGNNIYYSNNTAQRYLEKIIVGTQFPADQSYDPTSENPQSGKAVAEAIVAAITDTLGGDY